MFRGVLSMNWKNIIIGRLSLTPALSRWERGNYRSMVCHDKQRFGS
jgi:hypothetical protein